MKEDKDKHSDDENEGYMRRRVVHFRSRHDTENMVPDNDYTKDVNDRVVPDVTMDFLYKPHTVSVLVCLCLFLIYTAFMSDDSNTSHNAYKGLKASGVLFLIISALAFPNGPFIRPHPIIWRIIFGISVIYLIILQFTVFQSYKDIKETLKWLDPERLNNDTLIEKEYAVNCSDVTLERIWSHMDIFAVGHFLGWTMKALLIRHTIICWYISIAWEITELFFTHLLPNFAECWWDAIGLDILLCNGLGIFVGSYLCKLLEMREFRWESIKSIRTTKGKFKRAVLQFTPESWLKVDWFKNTALQRFLWVYLFVMIWLASELNTFFLKHIFAVDTSHPMVFWRIILIGLISAPSIRQFYVFATDPRVSRLGMQAWVYCAVCALEASICIKFGRQQFMSLELGLISLWIFILALGSFASVWLSVWWATYSSKTKEVSVNKRLRHCYLDSSAENLSTLRDSDLRKGNKSFVDDDEVCPSDSVLGKKSL
uniref:Phosphatidylserine synthase n=1 Tax=Parastrongyloides trichosuri TaxID=131310 RepID=A0A0N5A2P5_PARTI